MVHSQIIAISGIKGRNSLKTAVSTIAPAINGAFEALNFVNNRNKKGKTIYVRLGDKLNPTEVVHRVNSKRLNLKAFIPDVIPELQIATKPSKLLKRMQHASREHTTYQLSKKAVDNIMTEMQYKFTELYELSVSTQHKLLENIALIIYKRIKIILGNPDFDNDTSFKLTQSYRRKHRHSTDFPLIVSTLHSIQDAEGVTRTELQEKELTTVQLGQFSTLPYETLVQQLNYHITRISKQLVEHVDRLEVTPVVNATTAAEAAQVKVREQLKNLSRHLPDMVQHTIYNHLAPPQIMKANLVVKVFGEPYLPGKEAWMPFVSQFHVVSTIRALDMYNLLTLKVPKAHHLDLLKADGTIINGNCKLVIRPGMPPLYKVRNVAKKAGNVVPPPEPQTAPFHLSTLAGDQLYATEDMEWSEEL